MGTARCGKALSGLVAERAFPSLASKAGVGEARGSGSPRPEFSVDFYPGVACITLAFVDDGGAPISLASWPPSSPGPPDGLQEEEFEQLTQVTRCPVVPDSSSGGAAWLEEGCSDAIGTGGTLK